MLPERKTASKSSMPKRKLVGESSVRKDRGKDLAPGHSPRVQSNSETVRYCAYNQTRGLFLSNNVEAADSTSASLEDRLSKLKLDSGAALWFIPFRGLSATSVHFPIDLVYLNEDRVVLGAVESFPGSRVDPSVPPPASVLALPSRVIAIAGIQAGDQLILRTPEEIKRHLGQFQSSRSDIQVDPHLVHGQGTASHLDLSAHESADHALQSEDRSKSKPSIESAPAESPAPQKSAPKAQSPAPNPELPASKDVRGPKNWWQWLLFGEPPDPRTTPRESLPGLVAYFFTGSNPEPHGVRNISSTGMYVFTDERWYIGTVVRNTLTDEREPTTERSITLNAKVVRWGNDGVGLQFMIQRKKDQLRSKLPAHLNPTDIGSTEQFEQFLQRYRAKL